MSKKELSKSVILAKINNGIMTLNTLAKAIDELEERLLPVCNSQIGGAESGPCNEGEGGNSQLANQIDALVDPIDAQVNRINLLIDRLEI